MSDPLSARPAALPKGHSIAEYEIVRVLGAGGFGITYLAFDNQLDGPVAIKEYFPAELASRLDDDQVAAAGSTNREDVVSDKSGTATFAWGLQRFLDEARTVHRFRHPNVVQARRYLEANGTAYLVMEYVEGESLKAILDRQGSLSAEEWRPWMDALLDGLEHVHSHGYLHRDVKPANIVVRSEDGEPVLIDFGSARLQQRDRTHTQVLTAAYAPIEQHSTGATQGPPTDIYALAATSYRVLAGTPVSSAPDRVVTDDYEPLADRIAGPKLQWLAALDHGLAVKPQDRPQTVQQWRAELAATAASKAPATGTSTAGVDISNDSSTGPPETAEPTNGTGGKPARDSPDNPPLRSPDSPAVAAWETQTQDGESEYRTGALSRLGRTIMRPIAWVPTFIGDILGGGFGDFLGAARWWRRAAHLGSAVAPFHLGVCYFHGARRSTLQSSARGSELPRDHAEAAKWIRMAAVRGYVHGQPFLGLMYADGIEVPRDYAKAEKWCVKAAQGGPRRWGPAAGSQPLAQLVLGVLAARRSEDSKAENWLRRAASRDNAPAQYHLGSLIAAGRTQENNYAEAAKWIQKAAGQGHSEAQNALGFMYANGRGVARDPAEAETRFKNAAKHNLALAQYNLGCLYTERGNHREAERQFRLAAESNEPMAQSALAYLCVATPSPENGDKDRHSLYRRLAEAEVWYRRAVDLWSRRASESELSTGCPTAVFGSNDRDWIPHLSHWDHPKPGEDPDAIDLAGPDTWKYLYAYGWSPTPTTRGFLTWFLKGAERGSPVARHSLGRLYEHGRGVAKDLSEASRWYRLAARQGYSPAQAALGDMLEKGHGVTQDRTEACKWFREAAKRGEAVAQRTLGRRYETGDGVPVDKVHAARLYGLAAASGDDGAQTRLRHLHAEGYQRPDPEDTVESWKWNLWAAEQGHAEAQVSLGRRLSSPYDYGLESKVDPDPSDAAQWYARAAWQGNADGQHLLADCLWSGHGLPEDKAEALEWYKKAAKQGNTESQLTLGDAYGHGNRVPKDELAAFGWFRQAAQYGRVYACDALAFAYEMGRGLPEDQVRAYAWHSVVFEYWDSRRIHHSSECLMRTFERLSSQKERDRAERLAAEYLFLYWRPFHAETRSEAKAREAD